MRISRLKDCPVKAAAAVLLPSFAWKVFVVASSMDSPGIGSQTRPSLGRESEREEGGARPETLTRKKTFCSAISARYRHAGRGEVVERANGSREPKLSSFSSRIDIVRDAIKGSGDDRTKEIGAFQAESPFVHPLSPLPPESHLKFPPLSSGSPPSLPPSVGRDEDDADQNGQSSILPISFQLPGQLPKLTKRRHEMTTKTYYFHA